MTGIETALVGATVVGAESGIATTAGLIGSGGFLAGVEGLTLGTVAAGLGAGATILGQAQQANQTKKAAEAQAESLEASANQERAAAGIAAEEERRKARIISSNLQAKAAGSGLSASDIGATKLEMDIAGEGQYRSMVSLYNGESRATSLQNQASASRYEGEVALDALPMKVGSTLMDTATSTLKRKYG